MPGHGGADESPLLRVLNDANHRQTLQLSPEDRLRLCIWLDGNAPYYGTYNTAERAAQHRGQDVPPPRLQ
mgnify:CR=1 FL=1